MKKIMLILLLCSSETHAQIGFSVEAIPNSVFSNYNGEGIIPDGFFLKKYNFSFSTGASVYKSFGERFKVRLGYNYFVNNYRALYYKDSESPKFSFNRNTLQTSFFEPKFSLNYTFSVKSIQSIFVEVGAGISISSAPNYSINSELYFVNTNGLNDTLFSSINVSPIKDVSPIKAYFSVGKTVDLFESRTDRFKLDVMLTYRYSQNEEKISRTYLDEGQNYGFYYFRNSSFFGAGFRLNYQLK